MQQQIRPRQPALGEKESSALGSPLFIRADPWAINFGQCFMAVSHYQTTLASPFFSALRCGEVRAGAKLIFATGAISKLLSCVCAQTASERMSEWEPVFVCGRSGARATWAFRPNLQARNTCFAPCILPRVGLISGAHYKGILCVEVPTLAADKLKAILCKLLFLTLFLYSYSILNSLIYIY